MWRGCCDPGTPGRMPHSEVQNKNPTVGWDPRAGTLEQSADGADAVVHLAGASIAEGRWTAARKRVLSDSRIAATHSLIDSLKKLNRPPRVFIGASAIGFYGDRGDEELTESSPPGGDFLADLTRQWEGASQRASEFGARAVVTANQHRPRQKRRRTTAHDSSLPSWRRRPAGLGAAVDVLAGARRAGSDDSVCAHGEFVHWAGQRRLATPGTQRGLHESAGASPAASRDLPGSGLRFAPGAGRNGRWAAAR